MHISCLVRLFLLYELILQSIVIHLPSSASTRDIPSHPTYMITANKDSSQVSKTIFSMEKVAVIGSGNWGTAVAKKVAENLLQVDTLSKEEQLVKMWVFEEFIDGRKLTDIINTDHENVKYLSGVKLPNNVIAIPDIVETCRDADILLFVVPHQFLPGVLAKLKGNVKSSAIGVSLIKGIQFSPHGPELLSHKIQEELGLQRIAVVMGANVASDVVTEGSFAETCVASEQITTAKQVAKLFHSRNFATQCTTDVSTVELCGALKNIIAVGAGLCDGMGATSSTKAALLRQGLQEMAQFCQYFDESGSFQMNTLLLSAGVADLIVTCYSGRNRKCGAEFARRVTSASQGGRTSTAAAPTSSELWATIEADLLNGQKLQGVATCEEVVHCLSVLQNSKQEHNDASNVAHSLEGETSKSPLVGPGSILDSAPPPVPPGVVGMSIDRGEAIPKFPLIHRIHDIACKGAPLDTLFDWGH
mmetsp:Transcript_18453/g.31018  ORF Transcript_18453/g.31018 Transcript_18453/m.31018 type:complete len:474 (+) Transcript_18453:80-1501(+)